MAAKHCHHVSAECSVEFSVYGYGPNLAATIVPIVVGGICLLASLWIGVRKKTWSYLVAVVTGILLEVIGKQCLIA